MGEKIVQILPHPDRTATDEMIFVFESNEAGIHGAGAARFALHQKGAIWGQGVGLQGQSYGIPTKGGTARNLKTLSRAMITYYVVGFIRYAKAHPEMTFQVTAIGCGPAGLKHEDIAPMFYSAPRNCFFDTVWKDHLPPRHHGYEFWGTF